MRGSDWMTMTLLVTVLLVAAASDARAWSSATAPAAMAVQAVCDSSSHLMRLRGGFGVIGISGANNIKSTGSNPNLGQAMGSGSMSGTTTPPATDGRSDVAHPHPHTLFAYLYLHTAHTSTYILREIFPYMPTHMQSSLCRSS